jgi:hypothetical protein
MQILLINNDGAGFADYVTVEPDISVEKFFNRQLPHANTGDYLIRVNRQPVTRDQRLQEGDRVSLTPTKIAGATPAPAPAPGKFPGSAVGCDAWTGRRNTSGHAAR